MPRFCWKSKWPVEVFVQESTLSAPPVFLPLWVRIGLACLMFAVSLLNMWKGSWFQGAPYLCFGLHYLLYVPKQKAETFVAYCTKSRTIMSAVLLVAALAGFGNNLRVAFAR